VKDDGEWQTRAVLPPASSSRADRMYERFEPEPDPY
jgi:hypothetical protein